MKSIRKLLFSLLCTIILCGVFAGVVTEAAVSGPNPGDQSCAYVVLSDGQTYNKYAFDGIVPSLRQYYSEDTGKDIAGASYDKKTNTLTLKNCNVKYIDANEMGDDFTIRLEGTNTVTMLTVWGYGYGGCVTFTGDGVLNCNYLYLRAEKTSSTLTVNGKATVNLSTDEDYTLFFIDNTYVKENVIHATFDKKIELTENKYVKTETHPLMDGNNYRFKLLTKGKTTYYEYENTYYDMDVSDLVTKYDLYQLSGETMTLLKSYATEKDITDDGYTYVPAESTYTHVCKDKSMTLTAESGNSGNDTSTKAPAKGSVITASGAKYTVTKAGTSTKAGTAAFTKPRSGASSVTIPASITVDGIRYNVTSVSANAFSGNKTVKKVTIGKNVKTIGKKAFYNCKNLTGIKINTTKLTKTGVKTNAFKGISSKCTVTVPASKASAYKTILQKAGLSTKATVK